MTDETKPAELSLRDELAANLKNWTPDDSAGLSKAVTSAKEKQDDLRKFVKGEPATEDETETDEAPAEAETAEAQPEEAEAVEAEAETETPDGAEWLPQEQREAYLTATPEVQAAWSATYKSLQGNYTRATQQLGKANDRLGQFDAALSPVAHVIRAQGLTEGQAIQYLINQYIHAQQNPNEFLKQFAQARGISLDAADGNAQGFNSGLDDPRIKSLEQRLSQREQRDAARERALANADLKRAESHIQSFRDASDNAGKPLHPHFSKVEDAMITFVNTGMSLDEAYDKAIWADPEIRKQLVAEQTKALNKPAVKKVTSKPKASGSGTVTAKPNGETVRDDLAYQFEQARARAST